MRILFALFCSLALAFAASGAQQEKKKPAPTKRAAPAAHVSRPAGKPAQVQRVNAAHDAKPRVPTADDNSRTRPGSKSDETRQAHDDNSQTGSGSKSDETRQAHDDNSQTGPGSKSDETRQAHDDNSQTGSGSKSDETRQARDDNSQTGPASKSDKARQARDYAGRSRCGSA